MSNVQPKLIAREKWLQAMESGHYPQAIQTTREYSYIECRFAYCATGLGHEVLGGAWGTMTCTAQCVTTLREEAGLSRKGANLVVELNDGSRVQRKHTFAEIAAEIRAHPERFFEE